MNALTRWIQTDKTASVVIEKSGVIEYCMERLRQTTIREEKEEEEEDYEGNMEGREERKDQERRGRRIKGVSIKEKISLFYL